MNAWIRRGLQVGIVAAGLLVASGTSAMAGDGPHLVSDGNVGVGNGNQVVAPIQVPFNFCGNAIAVAGDATAWCEGGAVAKIKSAGHDPHLVSTDNVGWIVGNQVVAPIQVPIDISGNAAAAAGDATASSDGGAVAKIK